MNLSDAERNCRWVVEGARQEVAFHERALRILTGERWTSTNKRLIKAKAALAKHEAALEKILKKKKKR